MIKAMPDLNLDLVEAARIGDFDYAQHLIHAGADVCAESHRALIWTAIYWVYDNGKYQKTADVLVSSGADMTVLQQHLRPYQFYPFLLKHVATAHRGLELLMMLKPTPRVNGLRYIHPEMTFKQIHEQFDLMAALSLSPAQMAEMWRTSHPISRPQQIMESAPCTG